ncbi:unnamed protein product [Durusdinium trenchii]|uniref:EF-hand domain-containing protein n=1 Tax=Durusdinium trenchii TaxID=1381693 RepID=A0ABP0KLH5_9DINO
MKEIAHRVLKEWDKDGDKAISVSEAQCAASVTDGKISLSSLDPGAPTSFLKATWRGVLGALYCRSGFVLCCQGPSDSQGNSWNAVSEDPVAVSARHVHRVHHEPDGPVKAGPTPYGLTDVDMETKRGVMDSTYDGLKMTEVILSQEPRPELLLATPPPAYSDDLVDTEVVNSKLPSLVPVIAEKARGVINAPLEEQAKRSRSSVPAEFLAKASVVDTFSALGGASLQRRGYFSDDGIHPNERGTRLLALVVFADLRAKVSKYLRKRADEAAREVPDNPLGL